jgi:hypothetical protein
MHSIFMALIRMLKEDLNYSRPYAVMWPISGAFGKICREINLSAYLLDIQVLAFVVCWTVRSVHSGLIMSLQGTHVLFTWPRLIFLTSLQCDVDIS